ncbi:YciI family protein [Microbacterium gorillae]|uniref:YciI family protein n=1 Tax=Microbacterium gorillae TaxID=1231063 RepID=UPI00058D9F4E|nr:YciI family protein [Microbacterium gorillae]
MPKYLMLKHYRGGRAPLNDVPMTQWSPAEFAAHVAYMQDMERRLLSTGELVSSEGLAMDGVWVRYDGEGKPPITDGPFAETKDLIAGWMLVDVESYERALELAGELSAAPAAGGRPLGEWLELREVMDAPPADL